MFRVRGGVIVRKFTNEDLQFEEYPKNPELSKKLFDLYERAPAITNLEEWGPLLWDITKMHKKMVGCRANIDIVETFHIKVMECIRLCTSSLSVWRGAIKTSRELFLLPIEAISNSHCADKSCHAPHEDDYVCFCDEQ